MHLDSPYISHNFKHESAKHRAAVTPCSVFDALADLNDKNQTKNRDVQGISSKRWIIIHICVFDRAGREGALGRRVDLRHSEINQLQTKISRSLFVFLFSFFSFFLFLLEYKLNMK